MPAEGRKVAVDAVFDSVSVGQRPFRRSLEKGPDSESSARVSEAIKDHRPIWSRNYPRSVPRINPTTTSPRLKSAVFSERNPIVLTSRRGVSLPDGSCRSYFRINAERHGQFERTLIILFSEQRGSYGLLPAKAARAPQRDTHRSCSGPRWVEPSRWEGCRDQVFERLQELVIPATRTGKGGMLQIRDQSAAPIAGATAVEGDGGRRW